MDQMNPERRGIFGGLRPPFDLNMLALSLAAVAGFWATTELVEGMTGDANVLARMVDRIVAGEYRGVDPLKPISWVLEGGVALAFWAFFSAAISRIAAMKIAREETIDVREAAKFGAKKFVPVLSSVLFVATIVLVFYVVCNATLAGFAMSVPGLDVIMAVLFFTVLFSTFLIVFSLVLGLFGMNLAASAIATESSDTWDGISRAWNYILVRPWHVILCYGLTFAYLAVFGVFAKLFLDLSVSSLSIGPWGLGERTIVRQVDRADLPNYLQERVPESVKAAKFLTPGKGEFMKRYIAGGRDGWTGEKLVYYPTDRKWVDEYRASLSPDAQTEVVNWAGGANVSALIPTTWKITGTIVWFWLCLSKLLIAAYAVQYFFAATTKLYFLLRKEVEDEDFGEIVVEEEELEEEAAWDVKEPQKPVVPGATAPAGGLIMPKTLGAASAPAAPAATPAASSAAPAAPATPPVPAAPSAPAAPAASSAPAATPATPAAAPQPEKKA